LTGTGTLADADGEEGGVTRTSASSLMTGPTGEEPLGGGLDFLATGKCSCKNNYRLIPGWKIT